MAVKLDEEEVSEGRDVRSYMADFAQGYKATYEDQDMSAEEIEDGFKVLGDLDLDDMFGAFVEPNYGLIGGACTVDDYSEEGVTDRKRDGAPSAQNSLGQVSGAHGNVGRKYP
jgi:hypothetical protein